LLLAACVYGLMLTWHRGVTAISQGLHDRLMPVGRFVAQVEQAGIPRVPGTAVFLTRTTRDTPPIMAWHVKRNRALHERLFVLSVET
ncbi:KUP/HAK/KT family potassium transporter, partial [Stenotrophomonas maltophilia]|uniref:KUP/HAK/KT family potassium transporter n=1 Tax=Stenotrophomonas maltophilia TaxID=40324 RepID=UPI0019530FFC